MSPKTPAVQPVEETELGQVVHGLHGNPHGVLGPHPHDGAVTVRVLKPLASEVEVRWDGGSASLTHEHEGIWVGVIPLPDVPDYRVASSYAGDPIVLDDPYRFLPTLGDMDLHLINEGRHEQLWEVLGAHVRHYPGALEPVSGTSFAVWAPSARAVRIKADFNSWDGREHPMRQLGSSGVWELFVPGVRSGTAYKFVILGPDGEWREKADPMAAWAEKPADTASKIFETTYEWGDDAWLAERAKSSPVDAPMSVYEMHLGSWTCCLAGRASIQAASFHSYVDS